jgi:hypothetical protein
MKTVHLLPLLALTSPAGRAGQCPHLRANQTERGHRESDANDPKSTILSFLKPERSLILGVVGTWGCAFGFAFLLDGAAHYQFLNFIPIRLIAISFKPLLALAVLLTGAY